MMTRPPRLPKRPAFQFYPGDWRRDLALQSCSLAARGLWIEMMGLMHDGEPYGHLAVGSNGHSRAIEVKNLARMIGAELTLVELLVTELETANVFSRTEGGIIFSRRMVADERFRVLRGEHGWKGAEHGKKGGRPPKKPHHGVTAETPSRGGVWGYGGNPPAARQMQTVNHSPVCKSPPDCSSLGSQTVRSTERDAGLFEPASDRPPATKATKPPTPAQEFVAWFCARYHERRSTHEGEPLEYEPTRADFIQATAMLKKYGIEKCQERALWALDSDVEYVARVVSPAWLGSKGWNQVAPPPPKQEELSDGMATIRRYLGRSKQPLLPEANNA